MAEIIQTIVKWNISQDEYKKLAESKRAKFTNGSVSSDDAKSYAPALVTVEVNKRRNEACNSCEWKGDAGTCGCRPICKHESVRTMESLKSPNYWLKSATCPIGKWTTLEDSK